jgi:hypothetical protein
LHNIYFEGAKVGIYSSKLRILNYELRIEILGERGFWVVDPELGRDFLLKTISKKKLLTV